MIQKPKSKFLRKAIKIAAIITYVIMVLAIKLFDVDGYLERKERYRLWKAERAKRKLLEAIHELRECMKNMKFPTKEEVSASIDKILAEKVAKI